MKQHALLISSILEPMWVLAVITILGAWVGGLSGSSLFLFTLFFLVSMVLPAMGFRYVALKKKLVSDWDITNRNQRVKPLGALIGFVIVDFLLVRFFGNAFLSSLFLFYFIWVIGFFVITLFYKLSGHAAVVTLAALFIMKWFGLVWWPMLLLVPLISWSRLVLKRHSVGQLIVGFLYSLFIVVFVKV